MVGLAIMVTLHYSTQSVDSSTFHQSLFDWGKLWLDSDFGSIRCHWIKITNQSNVAKPMLERLKSIESLGIARTLIERRSIDKPSTVFVGGKQQLGFMKNKSTVTASLVLQSYNGSTLRWTHLK